MGSKVLGGDLLTVVTNDGRRYHVVLVDFDPDCGGDDEGGSVSIGTDAVPSFALCESDILGMILD